jgi:hypothetical protein
MPQSGITPEHLNWTDFDPAAEIVALGARRPGRYRAPSTARNVGPVTNVLCATLPDRGLVLEIASGAGQHIVSLAANRPGLSYQPSDPSAQAHESISAWIADSGLGNLSPPLALDVEERNWWLAVERPVAAMFCANMIHIAPWRAAQGLLTGAGALLPPGGLLAIYGPFKRNGEHTAPGNAQFDANLRAQNSSWGVRDLGDVAELAKFAGLKLTQIVNMPVNNLIVTFRRQ